MIARTDDPPRDAVRRYPWGSARWLVGPDSAAPVSVSLGEVVLNPGEQHATHVHPSTEEVLYVVSGEARQTIGDDESDLREGDAVHVPAGTEHSTTNTGWRPLRLVVVYRPGGAERDLDAATGTQVLAPGAVPRWVPAGPDGDA